MEKYIFLDRDGVINRERGTHTFLFEDFEWNDGLFEGLQMLAKEGYKFVVITNQSGIAQGKYGHKEVEILNHLIHEKFKELDCDLKEIFYCPHHPSSGKCLCRKPDSLMFEKAIHKFRVDITRSWMIGDKERDTNPAEKLGMKALLVQANTNFAKSIAPILAHG